MKQRRHKLLCIDDHEVSLAGWCLYLQNAGYSVETARSAQEGLELFATRPVDLVLLDYAMPEMNGSEVAAAMKRIKADVRIVLFTGASVPERLRVHIDAFIEKGQPPPVVLNRIRQLLEEP
jgi:CheY-like chemotaxis protein